MLVASQRYSTVIVIFCKSDMKHLFRNVRNQRVFKTLICNISRNIIFPADWIVNIPSSGLCSENQKNVKLNFKLR